MTLRNAVLATCLLLTGPVVPAQPIESFDPESPAARQAAVERLTERAEQRRSAAVARARAEGWPVRGRVEGRTFELTGLRKDGSPVYYITHNTNAAISTNAHLVRGSAPFNVDGAGLSIGVWDAGSVLHTHQEFGARVSREDGAGSDDHATHVGGTIGAAGVDSSARGMAPAVGIRTWEWGNDTGEMTAAAATGPGQTTPIYISNHSYGTISGWSNGSYSGNDGPHFFGEYPGAREDDNFGRYDYEAGQWDQLCFDAQYYLPFKSAGNDRNDAAPSPGTTFYYQDGGWQSGSYDPATGPYADGYDGGFDTIPTKGVAKNVMTVGAVEDAVFDGNRNPYLAIMTGFSGWGPADDGRVKPDIVANGASLYSPVDGSDTDYGYKSGTSMSSPNAAGSAQLLVSHYANRSGGGAMRASTLKGLIIHTADDLWNTGPDYRYGWGLMNTLAAARQIDTHFDSPGAGAIAEARLDGGMPAWSAQFQWDGVSPIRVTLCWTDPGHDSIGGLDNSTPALVHDLDLRLTAPDATIHRPWVLDRLNPGNDATTGDNTVDNVEQILLESPSAPGIYTIQVTHKGALSAAQPFSLIVSGQAVDAMILMPVTSWTAAGDPGGPFAPAVHTFTIQNIETTPIAWTAAHSAAWIDLAPTSGTLGPSGQAQVTASLNANAELLAAATTPYSDVITFTNQSSGLAQQRAVSLTVSPRLMAEDFNSVPDLAFTTIRFEPDGEGGYRDPCLIDADQLPYDLTGHALVNLGDDDSATITPSAPAPFHGIARTSCHINSNGNITFDSGDTGFTESMSQHMSQPRIAAFYNDMDPSSAGAVYWAQVDGDLVVTYLDVPQYNSSNRNTCQIVLAADGTLSLTWLDLETTDGIIGISDGSGLPAIYRTVDLSTMDACAPANPARRWQMFE